MNNRGLEYRVPWFAGAHRTDSIAAEIEPTGNPGRLSSDVVGVVEQTRPPASSSSTPPLLLSDAKDCDDGRERSRPAYAMPEIPALLVGRLREELRRLVASLRSRLPFSSHLVINTPSPAETDKLFHTLAQHFRKLKRYGVRVSWIKFVSFDRRGRYHLHVVLFHDVPLYRLFRRPGAAKGYDMPQFKEIAARLRFVGGTAVTTYRSYNYRIMFKGCDDPSFLACDYLLRPGNFRPDLVAAAGLRWFTASRNVVVRGTVGPVFGRIVAAIGSRGTARSCKGMVLVNGAVGDSTKTDEIAAGELIVPAGVVESSAPRDRDIIGRRGI
ncbi:hypothetical protein [Desulfofustis limnaeus]|uniref:hypothetical protein n=1 Tax=Desulfofustis limnaeus TaxID=2740163 RepID=UPI0024E0025B|nr:hypothetical protein [Desulfofustis limnaeus]